MTSSTFVRPVVHDSASSITPESEQRLMVAFRRGAGTVPAYRRLLEERGIDADQVVDAASFSRSCPLLSKTNTFDRFPLDQLSAGGSLADLAAVLTSSGHGGRFSFGVSTREQAAAGADFTDLALDAAFRVKSRATLAINCLPMGVAFSSRCMTVATTSVREDMAVALIQAFGDHYQQLLLVGDPLFMKRFTDHATEMGVDWSRYRANAVIGEEVFGEHFRGYMARCIGLNPDRSDDGYIMSSFGVAELGLHLCYETPATIALRRAAFRNPPLARDLFGESGEGLAPLPMVFTFDPRRVLIEVIDPDADGFGDMTTSMLDPELTIPLLRYQTGDVARLLDHEVVSRLAHGHGIALPGHLPTPLLALRGRDREALPNGSHVGVYKDALYADDRIARHLTGAVRLVFDGSLCTAHVQMAASAEPTSSLEAGILGGVPAPSQPARLVLWPYDRFPFGMRLDYERKFTHVVRREPNPASRVTNDATS